MAVFRERGMSALVFCSSMTHDFAQTLLDKELAPFANRPGCGRHLGFAFALELTKLFDFRISSPPFKILMARRNREVYLCRNAGWRYRFPRSRTATSLRCHLSLSAAYPSATPNCAGRAGIRRRSFARADHNPRMPERRGADGALRLYPR